MRCVSSKEKENDVTIHFEQQTDEEYRNLQDLLLLRKVRTRMQRSQRNISKLKDNLRSLKKCVASCLDILESASDSIAQTSVGNKRMLRFLEENDLSSVSPGNPVNSALERANTSLRGLTPPLSSEIGSSNDSWSDDEQEESSSTFVSDSELLSSEEETSGIYSA